MARSVGFVGLGYALPELARGNADPLFQHRGSGSSAHGVSEAELFTGVVERRAVRPGESAEALGVQAAQAALSAARLTPAAIDRLYGCVSPSTRLLPNGLFEVHRQLGLPGTTLVVPIATEFTNFVVSCALAKEAISSGACEHVMVVCAGAWTGNMDFANPHAWSIGDGAAAAILGPSESWLWLGHAAATHSAAIASMTLPWHDPATPGTRPTFQISSEGVKAFLELGVTEPPRLLRQLMSEHGVGPEQLTLVSHQPSSRLMDIWTEQLTPHAYLSSLAELGNMTLATVGVNLARDQHKITTDYVGCLTLGLGQHFAVALIKR